MLLFIWIKSSRNLEQLLYQLQKELLNRSEQMFFYSLGMPEKWCPPFSLTNPERVLFREFYDIFKYADEKA